MQFGLANDVSLQRTANLENLWGVHMDWNFIPQRKVEWADIAADIRDTVTMDEVLSMYAPQVPTKNHRCPCPFHDGHDYNFSYTQHGYRCFVCGATGDVITFVKEVLGCPTRVDAMKRINYDFHLNLPIGANSTSEISTEMLKRREARKTRDAAIRAWWDEYHRLWDEWTELDKIRLTADPESEDYAYAVHRIDYIAYLIDSMPEEPR